MDQQFRWQLLLVLIVISSCSSPSTPPAPKTSKVSLSVTDLPKSIETHPVALVYRGPAGCQGCSEAAAELLRSSKWGFDVQYVGPNERLQISDTTLKMATLYVQPGGNGTVEEAFAAMRGNTDTIRKFVKSGGRYLGLCMGGYLAGSDPGFNLLQGDTDEFTTSRGASVTTKADTIVKVNWRNRPRYMYFQDGPYFILHRGAKDVSVLATYTNGEIAVMVAPYGKGKVGVSGPHPEATTAWYDEYKLVNPDGVDAGLGHDLIDTLMQ